MKNHRHLRNSSMLRLCIFIVLGLCLIPLLPALATPHGLGGICAASLFGMVPLRLMEKADDPAAPDAVGVGDAIKAIEDKTMTVGQRLDVAYKALKGVDPTGQLAQVKNDLDKATADLKSRDEEISKLKADLEKSQKQVAALEADVKQHDEDRAKAEKESADLRAKEQDLDKRAEAKSKERLKSLGFNSSQLPPQNGEHQSKEEQEKNSPEAKIRRLKGNDRIMAGSHYKAHGKLPDWVDAKLAEMASAN